MSTDRIIHTERTHPLLKPFRVTALVMGRALGDFALNLFGAISVKDHFEDAALAVYCHDDRPFKKALLACAPQVDTLIQYPQNQSMPVDYFDSTSGNPIFNKDPRWNEKGLAVPSMVLTQSMLSVDCLSRLARLDHLRFPEDLRDRYGEELAVRGVDPTLGFCCIHYRENNYKLRTGHALRDTPDPERYEQLRDYLIDELGLQVVRVGHPEQTEFRPRKGFVDLRDADEDFFLHAYAISQARFNLMGPSGPSSVSVSFGVPTGLADHIDFYTGINTGDVALQQVLYDPDGRRIPTAERLEKGLTGQGRLTSLIKQGFSLRHNSSAELSRLADHMYAISDPQKTLHATSYAPARSNSIQWPPTGDNWRSQCIEMPDLE